MTTRFEALRRRLGHLVMLPCAVLLAAAAGSSAGPPGLPRLQPLVGVSRSALVDRDDTLLDIAYEEHLGFSAVARLNPDLDEWIPAPGSVVRLPTRYVLPDVSPEGLVLNVPEMRLYDFRAGAEPEVFAAAVGDAEDPTPLGEFRIGEKRVNPVWNVPESIRSERPGLPAQVPPGPENPLGSHWMTLGASSYGIHGTNIRWSIGRMATHGCVRLYEDDMERLFARTPRGTRLRSVYQTFKWGVQGDGLYLEAHPDLYALETDPLSAALATPQALGLFDALDLEAVRHVLEARLGVPVRVGSLPAAVPTSIPPS